MAEQVLEVRCEPCGQRRQGVRAPLVAVCMARGGEVVVSGAHRESRSAAQARSGGRGARRTLLVPPLWSDGVRWVAACRSCGGLALIERRNVLAACSLFWPEVEAPTLGLEEFEAELRGSFGGEPIAEWAEDALEALRRPARLRQQAVGQDGIDGR